MQTVSALCAVKEWLEKQIEASHVELKRPDQDGKITAYTLAAPSVHIGFVPPNGIVDPAVMRIPCLVVGTPETTDDHDTAEMELQLTAIVYDPGLQKKDEKGQQLQLTPNFDGYITLLNFLDRVKSWVQKNDSIAGKFQLESSVRLKTYEEQPWPYWYGFLSFTVSGVAYPMTRYAEILN